MNEKRLHAVPGTGTPITEADLHAYADGQLPPARRAEVETFLAAHPQDQGRVDEWREQRRLLHAMLDPV
ncbi:anti-sigma factor family protein, partial [Achromobacter insolitus]